MSALKKRTPQRWVRLKRNDELTDNVWQMSQAFLKRVGIDMIEITEKEAMIIRARVDTANQAGRKRTRVQTFEAEYQEKVSKQPELKHAAVQETPILDEPMAGEDGKPLSAEEAMARVAEENGDDLDVPITDGLDDMTRNELFALIEKDELDVKKVGKKVAVVDAIRLARAEKVEKVIETPEEPEQPETE